MALAHPSHEAFIDVVNQAVTACGIAHPRRVIALRREEGGIVVRLIDVSSRDARGVASLRETRAEGRRDLRDKIAELLPKEYTGTELIFLNERVAADTLRHRWIFWNAQSWCPESIQGKEMISLEYKQGP